MKYINVHVIFQLEKLSYYASQFIPFMCWKTGDHNNRINITTRSCHGPYIGKLYVSLIRDYKKTEAKSIRSSTQNYYIISVRDEINYVLPQNYITYQFDIWYWIHMISILILKNIPNHDSNQKALVMWFPRMVCTHNDSVGVVDIYIFNAYWILGQSYSRLSSVFIVFDFDSLE